MRQALLQFLPKTPFGVRSARLLSMSGIMLVVDILFFMMVDTTISDAEWFRMTILPVYSITLIGTGLIGGVYAWLAIIRQHERSVLSWACAGLGVLILFFLLGEFLVPH